MSFKRNATAIQHWVAGQSQHGTESRSGALRAGNADEPREMTTAIYAAFAVFTRKAAMSGIWTFGDHGCWTG